MREVEMVGFVLLAPLTGKAATIPKRKDSSFISFSKIQLWQIFSKLLAQIQRSNIQVLVKLLVILQVRASSIMDQ